MTTVYHLTDKEQEIIEAYREVGEMGRTLIECAASSTLKTARMPKPTAQIFEFLPPKIE